MELMVITYSQMIIFMILGVWELIWKGIAMWDTAKKGKSTWFVFILILNTVGILPLVYLLFFKDKKKKGSVVVQKNVKKKKVSRRK